MTLGERDPSGISRFDYVPSVPIDAYSRSTATAPTGPSIHLREPFSQVFLLSRSQVQRQRLLRSPFRAPPSIRVPPHSLSIERHSHIPKRCMPNIEFHSIPPPVALSLHTINSIPKSHCLSIPSTLISSKAPSVSGGHLSHSRIIQI